MENCAHFECLMKEFFTTYYQRRPVNATFIGIHDYDNLLPDFSDHALADMLAETKSLLQRFQDQPRESLNFWERADCDLAEGYLRSQVWELESDHFYSGNPSFYVGEAVFGMISLFLAPYSLGKKQVDAAVQRLLAIPNFLETAKKNLTHVRPAWNQRAIEECDGALALLSDGVEEIVAENRLHDQALEKAAKIAWAAFKEFKHHLSEIKIVNPRSYGCGPDAFRMLMEYGHFIKTPLGEMLGYAEEQVLLTNQYLEVHASDFKAATPAEALAQLTDLHPSAEQYYGRYMELWKKCRVEAIRHQLLSWPDFPIEYVPQPKWARKAAPHLYFLFYRAPAAFNCPTVHQYLVSPLEDHFSPEEQEKFLKNNNDSLIKLNHVVHHGSIGHHVQNWHAYRSNSKIGRVAAVDCASRIAMFCGGTMAEGWAVYATELMAEVGFLTPLEEYAEVQTRRRMSARAVVDIRLHTQDFSLEDAANYYVEKAGMPKEAARREAVRNSMYPGTAMMYIFACDRIKQLRRDYSALLGSEFSLKEFHNQFLGYGSIPVEMIYNDMMRMTKNVK